jgi:hypothetical protein
VAADQCLRRSSLSFPCADPIRVRHELSSVIASLQGPPLVCNGSDKPPSELRQYICRSSFTSTRGRHLSMVDRCRILASYKSDLFSNRSHDWPHIHQQRSIRRIRPCMDFLHNKALKALGILVFACVNDAGSHVGYPTSGINNFQSTLYKTLIKHTL